MAPLAYFITFTTYGAWLHGRAPGSVDRMALALVKRRSQRLLESRKSGDVRSSLRQTACQYRVPQSRSRIAISSLSFYAFGTPSAV
jgi:hypothetical protein